MIVSVMGKHLSDRPSFIKNQSSAHKQQVLPALEPLYMGWEKNYNSSPVYEWMKSVPWLPVRPFLFDLGVCSI